jgi:hypothetical protein
MMRAVRRRFVLLTMMTVGFGGAAAAAAAAQAGPNDPTVTFQGSGTPPLACGSIPDQPALTILVGTKVVVANQTGASATVMIGTVAGTTLEHGEATRVRLKKGQHTLTLVPDCAVVTTVGSSVITVNEPEDEGEPDPDPEAPGSGATRPPGRGTGSTGAPLVAPGVSTATPTAASPSSTPATPLPGPDGDVAEFEPSYALGVPPVTNGNVLLAIISLICILGVTAGIIRAILAQRADNVIHTS